MKLPCEMIRDLLPLYHDGVCSPVSKTLVTEHLRECESCAMALQDLKSELQMPKLEGDEEKPLKTIRRRWRKKTCLLGICIGIVLFFLWGWLTQSSSVKIEPKEYTVTNVACFSNGMYYLEYQLPYVFSSSGADLLRTEDGCVYLQEYRPILTRKDTEDGLIRIRTIAPAFRLIVR